jgi:hypothetical protein
MGHHLSRSHHSAATTKAGRSVLTLTLACDRAGCLAVDAVAVPTDDHLAHTLGEHGQELDYEQAAAIAHDRGWQTGRPCRCPQHVTPSWRARHPGPNPSGDRSEAESPR